MNFDWAIYFSKCLFEIFWTNFFTQDEFRDFLYVFFGPRVEKYVKKYREKKHEEKLIACAIFIILPANIQNRRT